MIVDSNLAASLQYVDPTYQTSLFVRANIYDLSGGAPVLEGFVNLAQINNGFYSGKYSFTAGKPYLVQKLVYTDGTYSTVDQNYAGGSDDVQCIDLKTANLDAAISTRAAQATVALDATVAKTADSRFAFLDVAISSRNAVAPDNATIAAIAGYVDTEVAAIKVKTDLIPASPASETTLLAVKASTDNLPSDPADNSDILDAIDAIPTGSAPTVQQIVDGVWDETLSDHLDAGSTGEKLNYLNNDAGSSIVGSQTPEIIGEVDETSSEINSEIESISELSGEVE